jgi:hypothetical protein
MDTPIANDRADYQYYMPAGSMSMGDGVPSLFTLQKMYWAVVGSAIGVATLVNPQACHPLTWTSCAGVVIESMRLSPTKHSDVYGYPQVSMDEHNIGNPPCHWRWEYPYTSECFVGLNLNPVHLL